MSTVEYRPDTLTPAANQPQNLPARRGPGRPRADASVDDEAFLEAALRVFAVRGYDGVSVRTLSKELGVSHGWVHQRYGGKQGLWYAAVDHSWGRQSATIVFDPLITDPLEQLEHGIRLFLRHTAEHPEFLLIMNAEGAEDTERLAYIYTNYAGPTIEPFERLVRHLIDAGRIRPVTMRTLFLLLGHGGTAPFALVPLARHMDRSDPTSPKNIDDQIETVTRIIIDGLRTDR